MLGGAGGVVGLGFGLEALVVVLDELGQAQGVFLGHGRLYPLRRGRKRAAGLV